MCFGFKLLGESMEDILHAYSTIEFLWATFPPNSNRKYFFSRKIVLFFIVNKLNLDVIVPVLKDEYRTKIQLENLKQLIEKACESGAL